MNDMQSSVVTNSPAPTRSVVWFDDGNLILQAQKTQFRIHRGIICASSTVFKDMFDLPQLTSGDEVVEGCPVVHLSDSAVDVQHVLKAIYDRRYTPESPLPMVWAFLRLGKKYEINGLHGEAVEFLQQYCPPTLAAFDRKKTFNAVEYYVHIINVAIETSTFILLPAALSSLLTKSSLRKIAGGLSKATKNICPLRPEGLTMLCLGYHRLRQTALRSFIPTCPTRASCSVSALKQLQRLEADDDTILTLTPWHKLDMTPFCTSCMEDLGERWHDRRKSVWKELPCYYGLPPWKELLLSS